MSELREIGFTITEEPGAFITTPSVWHGTAFTCEKCKKPIGERQPMFVLMKEGAPTGWRHVYLEDCGRIAYTVGLASSYDSDIDAKAAKGEKVQKMGRLTADQSCDGKPYDGGWIWRTQAEAQVFLNSEPAMWKAGRAFKVYGVVLAGTWDSDTSPEVYEDGVHRLWVTSTEVFKL